MNSCVNLRQWFGQKYRIRWDEADESNHQDPWMMTIPCRLGTIYPYGGDMLAVEVDGHNPTANRLAVLPDVIAHQIGDFERTYLFHVGLFEQIAALVHPHRKPELTDEQRQDRADRMAAFRTEKKAGLSV
jgi:hypothetical protein